MHMYTHIYTYTQIHINRYMYCDVHAEHITYTHGRSPTHKCQPCSCTTRVCTYATLSAYIHTY